MSDEAAPAESETSAEEKPAYCTYEDFMKLQLRVAEIVAAEAHPNADKLLKLQLRVGEKTKQICAGIKAFYEPEALVGKRIVIIDNLEPRKLRGEVSEGMLLAASDEESGRVVILTTDAPDVPSGSKVS